MFNRRLPILLSLVVLALISIPYLFAAQLNDAQSIFGGFLINPIDGHSYLAKMQQGFRGEWRFVLPYTAEPGAGAYLFLFYLTLGHIARLLNIPLLIIFHGTRVVGAGFLLWVLYRFNRWVYQDKNKQNLGFAIGALGSGMGWLAVLAGMFTSDFWVAEAYPFLSMYANPHFAIGLALMILALMPARKETAVVYFLLGLAIGIIQPFAVVIVVLIKAAMWVSKQIFLEKSHTEVSQSEDLLPSILFAVGGGSILIYQYWSIMADPVLSFWNNQNVTISPDLLDLFISLSPCLIFAIIGVSSAWKDDRGKLLVIWAALSLILTFVPWNLQRRFLTGIFLPIAGLAVFGLDELKRNKIGSIKTGILVLFLLALPTNILVVYSGIQAASKEDPKIFLSRNIQQALSWVSENTEDDTLVLADENLGLIIPSLTGRKVIYGHPFETVDAVSERDFLHAFFNGDHEPAYYDHVLEKRNVDLIFVSGDISSNLETWIGDQDLSPAYKNREVKIYLLGD